MNDDQFENIIKSINKEAVPPAGLKEKMLAQILNQENIENNPVLSKVEMFIFEKPLRTACALSVAVSSILWAVIGNGYCHILTSIIRIR